MGPGNATVVHIHADALRLLLRTGVRKSISPCSHKKGWSEHLGQGENCGITQAARPSLRYNDECAVTHSARLPKARGGRLDSREWPSEPGDGSTAQTEVLRRRRALVGTEQRLGPDDPDSRKLRRELALALLTAGAEADGIALLERIHADLLRSSDPHEAITFESKIELAGHYFATGRRRDAVALLEEVGAQPEAPDALRQLQVDAAHGHLVSMALSLGRTDEELLLFDEIATIVERVGWSYAPRIHEDPTCPDPRTRDGRPERRVPRAAGTDRRGTRTDPRPRRPGDVEGPFETRRHALGVESRRVPGAARAERQ